MTELLQIGLLPLIITHFGYQAGLWIQKKTRSALCNPIILAVILVLGFMALTGMENADYQAGAAKISWLMTPATLCLAIPMYEQLSILKKNWKGILAGVAAGSIACILMIILFCFMAGFDRELTISLLPKSVTSAIGVPLSELSGGIGAITTPAIIITGIVANILAEPLFRLLQITDPAAQGAALGTSGHVIATSKANELGELVGAVSSLSLVVAGLLTSVLLPVLASFL